jgi:hypothetical protein
MKDVDLLFLVDTSQSMEKCFAGLRTIIEGLVDELQQNEVRVNLGVLGADWKCFRHLPLTLDRNAVKAALETLETKTKHGSDEFLLPALDYALDLPWKSPRRIIAVFTDECLSTGHDPEFQKSKIEPLRQKLWQSYIYVYFFGRDCEDYQGFFANIPRAVYNVVVKKGELFGAVDFAHIRSLIVKSASLSAPGVAQVLNQDVYGIREKTRTDQL